MPLLSVLAEATLSLFRAAGALSGLSATLAFQPARRYFGLVTSGTFGITWQLTCLVIGVTPVLVTHLKMDNRMKSSLLNSAAAAPSDLAGDGSAAMLYVLLCGLVASRLGLWLFDLAVTQLQQEQVPDNQLGMQYGQGGLLVQQVASRSRMAEGTDRCSCFHGKLARLMCI